MKFLKIFKLLLDIKILLEYYEKASNLGEMRSGKRTDYVN